MTLLRVVCGVRLLLTRSATFDRNPHPVAHHPFQVRVVSAPGVQRVVERFDAVTEDPGRIDELTRQMFGAGARVERSDGRAPSLRLAQAATAEFGVQRVTWNVDGRCDVGPLGQFLCIRLGRGAYGLDQGGGSAQYVAGDTFLVDPTRKVAADVVGRHR